MLIQFDAVLDATLDESPVPTIRTKEMLDTLSAGEILKVITRTAFTVKNIKTLVENNPFELLEQTESEEGFVFFIKKL